MKNFKDSELTTEQQATVAGRGKGKPAWGKKGGRKKHDADFFKDKGKSAEKHGQPWVIAGITKEAWHAKKKG